MSKIEEFLELQDKLNETEEKLTSAQIELNAKNKKLVKISEELNKYQNSSVKNETEVKYLTNRISLLEDEKAKLQKEQDRWMKDISKFSDQLEKFSELISTLNVNLKTKENLLLQKDKQVEELERRLKEQMEINIQYKEEKAQFIEEKIQKMVELEKGISEEKARLEKIQKKHKTAKDDLFSKTMQIDQLRTKITELEVELSKYKPSGDDINRRKKMIQLTQLAGIDDYFDYIQSKIANTKDSIFIVMPSINDIDKFDFLNSISNTFNAKQIQVACKASLQEDFQKIQDLRNKGIKFSNKDYVDFYAACLDEKFIAICDGKDENFFGIASDDGEFAKMMSTQVFKSFKKN